MTARQVFQRHVKGNNVMTPDSIEFGFIGSTQVYEITTGTGFDHQPIYGVTVIDRQTGKLQHGVGNLFRTVAAARTHVAALQARDGAIRYRRALTPGELQRCVDAAGDGFEACLTAVYDVMLSWIGSSMEAEDEIVPSQFQLPYQQVKAIVDASEPWFGLDWMNVGPASYIEEEE